jgi:hypothetical protein
VKASEPAENVKTFFDSEVPGIRIQVNATTETQPNEYVFVKLSLKALTSVHIKYFNLSIFGFINGTHKVLMTNITDNDFSLNTYLKEYNCTFRVPENIWDVTYGEMALTYNVTYTVGSIILVIPYENLTFGFTMTHVRNIYVEKLENDLKNLNDIFGQLNQTFWESFNASLSKENIAQLNETYREYQQRYNELQGILSELDNTRSAVAFLVITTIFFVVTTAYLALRRPKQYW